jgi:uncharacterized protein YecE (DUF72 family)
VAERRSVAADVVGSKPTSRPKTPPPGYPPQGPAHKVTPSPAPDNLYIGTSGWAYPTWKPGFYPKQVSAKKFLEFYASQMNSVEVNYTFRTLPSATTLENWLRAVPENFRFTFKAPQRITHFNRLRDSATALDEFVAAVEPVQQAGKLGLLLFQLPPNFQADLDRLSNFLALPKLQDRKIAFEFRHQSWFTEAVYELLRARNAALCIAESDDLATPEVHLAIGYTCFRLRRNGGYSEAEIAAFAARFLALARDREVYTYFKHEDEPTGALNASALLKAASPVAP